MNAIQDISKINWELPQDSKNSFSSDDVVDAYIKGKRSVLEQNKKAIYSQLEGNIIKAGNDTELIAKHLSSKGISVTDIYLNPESWNQFVIMIVIPESDFLDDKILSIYDFLSDYEIKVSNDMYNLQFNICGASGSLDISCVESDGFVLKYNK